MLIPKRGLNPSFGSSLWLHRKNKDNIRDRENPGTEIRRFLTLSMRNFTYSTLGF